MQKMEAFHPFDRPESLDQLDFHHQIAWIERWTEAEPLESGSHIQHPRLTALARFSPFRFPDQEILALYPRTQVFLMGFDQIHARAIRTYHLGRLATKAVHVPFITVSSR